MKINENSDNVAILAVIQWILQSLTYARFGVPPRNLPTNG